jgi:predicted CxxxxCH...CXXCH cytochrome family protein
VKNGRLKVGFIFLPFIIYLLLLLTHKTMAVEEGKGCGSCHEVPPKSGAHTLHFGGDVKEAAYGDDGRLTNDPAKYKFNCGNCHPLETSKHENGSVDIELHNPMAKGIKSINPTSASWNGTFCSNIYCHSSGQVASVRAYVPTPNWVGGSFANNRCAGCHGDPPAYPSGGTGAENANSHHFTLMGSEAGHLVGIHFDGVSQGHGNATLSTTISCNTCHAKTVSANTNTYTNPGAESPLNCSRASCHTENTTPPQNNPGKIADTNYHVNGSRDVAFSAIQYRTRAQLEKVPAGWERVNGYKQANSYDITIYPLNTATYDSVKKTCSNVACHLGGGASVPWGRTDGSCISCHTDF